MCALCDRGLGLELDQGESERQQYEHEGDTDIRQSDRVRLQLAISLQFGCAQRVDAFRRQLRGATQDNQTTKKRCDKGSDGVEGLGEIQAAGRGGRGADHRDVGVHCDLNGGHAAGEDDERAQEDREQCKVRGGNEPGSTERHNEQSDNHGLLVSEPLNQTPGGIAEDEVGREEGELNHHGFGVVELEDALEVRNDDVVETGEKTHHEKQCGRDGHGTNVSLHLWIVVVTGGTDVAYWDGQGSSFENVIFLPRGLRRWVRYGFQRMAVGIL